MKVTDQIQAVRCLGIDPMRFFVLPRFCAVAITAVLLLIFGLVISVLGGMISVYFIADIHPEQYLLTIARFASTTSLVLAVSKSIAFGILMGLICCYNGYRTEGGTFGVGDSVRNTAVQSMVAIVLADFSITWVVESIARLGSGL